MELVNCPILGTKNPCQQNHDNSHMWFTWHAWLQTSPIQLFEMFCPQQCIQQFWSGKSTRTDNSECTYLFIQVVLECYTGKLAFSEDINLVQLKIIYWLDRLEFV